MKRFMIFYCLSAAAVSCNNESQQSSDVKSYASDLSGTTGKLAKTFLYLSEAGQIVQRECQVAAPRSAADCSKVRSTRGADDFRQAVKKDIELSQSRLNQGLESLNKDRSQILGRKTDFERQVSDLKGQLDRLGPIPSGSNPGGFLGQALDFARTERDKLKAQLAVTSDPTLRTQMQEALQNFDIQIAQLEAQAGGSGNDPNAAARADLNKRLTVTKQSLDAANADLSGLDDKIAASKAQQTIAGEELRTLDSAMERLKQSVVFDARGTSNTLPSAEKQLVSRFHKLFTEKTPDCNQRSIDGLKELAIGNPAVFTSREAQVGGAWHFGEVLKPLLGGNPNPKQVETFVRAWVSQWQTEFRSSNGDRAAARPDFMGVVDRWKNASGARGIDGLDLRIAPFRLIGITNRFDLRNPLVSGSAGESRLVYGLLEEPTERPQNQGLTVKPFTMIFEYKVAVASDNDLSKWLNLWHDLGTLNCSESNCNAYTDKLSSITRMFTKKEGTLLRSSLGQVRSNEIAFGSPWEQREFNISNAGVNSRLQQVDPKRTPAQSVNNSQQLADFVNSISLENIKSSNYEIPNNMRAAKAQVFGANPEWKVAVDSDRARAFNLNTCNGCHSSDQAVIDGFYHVSPFQGLGVASMSSHLKDQELPRRAKIMAPFLVAPECSAGMPFDARLAAEGQRMLSRPVH